MVVPVEELTRFIKEAMVAVGTVQEHAEQMADVLVAADCRGHYSHGLNRLEMYVTDVESKTTDANAKPVVLKESPATAWVDGNNGLGPVVGSFCMQLAITKAKSVGVGWVAAKRSNHYGIAGWYARTALEHGLLGMSFTNTSPLMGPTRATKAALGTNPLSLAAPGKSGDSFVLDMATTAVAVGKIEVQRRKGEPITEGWAQDAQGQSTTDADLAFKTKCLMPLGGPEITSGYKGYGLGLLVETFCGILSGKADPFKPVMVPGDPERNHMKLVDEEGGVPYHENQLKASEGTPDRLLPRPCKIAIDYLLPYCGSVTSAPDTASLYTSGAARGRCCAVPCVTARNSYIYDVAFLYGFTTHNYVRLVAMVSSTGHYGPAIAQVCNWSSLTRTVTHMYNTALAVRVTVHTRQPILDGQYWLRDCDSGCNRLQLAHDRQRLYAERFSKISRHVLQIALVAFGSFKICF
ncbi:hypothetical protein Cfor_07951 [Coptotermes formosanus]|uniref:Malate dehydrogenase n=1 Tax=Coptotermes formosanus TaxID=36987 RepID=A0A6L2PA63_COPFO|nr:hypothetical protein Cfor_07951 [Coptotermes formosanus]